MSGVRLRGYRIRARVYAVLMGLAFAASALLVRAVDVQVLRKEFYQSQGDARHLREIEIPTTRGAILDRNGELLAMSSPVDSLWVNPRVLIADHGATAELAASLGMPVGVLDEKSARVPTASFYGFVGICRRMRPSAF